MARYIINTSDHTVEMAKPNSTILIYRISYGDLCRNHMAFTIPNRFIVYILFGKNDEGKDVLYIGKSKNGLANRPTAHKDKYVNWTECFILTQFKERTFFNDGVIQYLEDLITKQAKQTNSYQLTTIVTNTGTVNETEREDCREYLEEAYKMLDVLGLDLLTPNKGKIKCDIETPAVLPPDTGLKPVEPVKTESAPSVKNTIPDGIYHFSMKIKRMGNRVFTGEMSVENDHIYVLPGSLICPIPSPALAPGTVKTMREEYLSKVPDLNQPVILKERLEFHSVSTAATFLLGQQINGWDLWRNKNGQRIDIYRKQTDSAVRSSES